MVFNDGVSNPQTFNDKNQPIPLFSNVVWTTKDGEGDILKDGTYMVFQKIEHDLDERRELSLCEQQEWVVRSKGTGLLLDTRLN